MGAWRDWVIADVRLAQSVTFPIVPRTQVAGRPRQKLPWSRATPPHISSGSWRKQQGLVIADSDCEFVSSRWRRLPATSLTEAAADAGFSSPSHLSDTVRAVFGFTAIELLGTGLTVVLAEHR